MSRLSPIFHDRESQDSNDLIEYDPTLRLYVTASLSQSMSTPATARVGNSPLRVLSNLFPGTAAGVTAPVRTFEPSVPGGARIRNIQIFEEEQIQNINPANDTTQLDMYRTGRNIQTYQHFASFQL